MHGGVLVIGWLTVVYAVTRVLFRDPGEQVSDALTTVAQVDAALLIALALKVRAGPSQRPVADRAVEYGTAFAAMSLLLALSELWRPDTKAAAAVAMFLMFLSTFSLLVATFGPGAAHEVAEFKETARELDRAAASTRDRAARDRRPRGRQ